MNPWLAACAVMLLLGLLPTMWLGSRGDEMRRLVALQLFGQIAVLCCMAFARAVHQSSYLIVPLVLAVMSVTGTLVFTRLSGPRP